MKQVAYHDDWGIEHQHGKGLCEYCGSPVNRYGEAILFRPGEGYDDLTKQALARLVLCMWDAREQAEVIYYRVILGKTTEEIGTRLGKSRQAINHLLVKGAKQWPELARLLFERNNATTNRKAMRRSPKKLFTAKRKAR